MAGMIFFTENSWSASSWLTFLVMERLADQIDDSAMKDKIIERVDNNLPTLDLSDPTQSPLLDIIVEYLPHHIPVLQDPTHQPDVDLLINQLVGYARTQQQHNRTHRS
jgi:hypothetical protein